jgi:hypothetical protein
MTFAHHHTPALKGMVLSDLHLASLASHGPRVLRDAENFIRFNKTGLIVLNGDIIEAREITGTKAALERKLGEAVAHIEKLVKQARRSNPDCRVVFVYGNHDCCFALKDRLDVLAEKYPHNFETEDHYFTFKNARFLHGDLPLNMGTPGIQEKFLNGTLADHIGWVHRPATRSEGKHGWFHLRPVEGLPATKINATTIFHHLIDQPVSALVMPIRTIARVVLRTLEAHDLAHPETPILNDAEHIFIGHIHPPHDSRYTGNPTTLYPNKQFHVWATGAATSLSRGTYYVFDINEHGVGNVEVMGKHKAHGVDPFVEKLQRSLPSATHRG